MTNYWILPLRRTIHSPHLCGLLLARCQYLHRFNIVRVGHPTTVRMRIFFNVKNVSLHNKYNYFHIKLICHSGQDNWQNPNDSELDE